MSSLSDFVIREATDADAAEISSLYREVWQDYADKFPLELLQSRTPPPEGIIDWMREGVYFVADIDDGIIGVVGCISMHGTCQLTHLAVAKNHRKRGVGKSLVERVVSFAKEKRAAKVWLDTVPFLDIAISLYKKYGFKKCGHLRKHFWNLDVDLYELVFE